MGGSYRYRYALGAFLAAALYVGALFGIHYAISGENPARLFTASPTVALMIILILPFSFVVGYFWGAGKDQRSNLQLLEQRQREHLDLAENISSLLRRNEEMRLLTGMAAREMKHPLTSIIGYTLTLQQYWDKMDEGEKRRLVEFIRLSSVRLEVIANDILRITELAKIGKAAESGPVNLKDILVEVTKLLETVYAQRRITISLRGPDHPPPVKGDPAWLFDLVYNLLDLCMHISEDDAVLSAWISRGDGKLQLRLRCPASSFPADKLRSLEKQIPDPNRPGATAVALQYRLARQLLAEMDGEIKMEFFGEKGVSFILRLPTA
jgi:signal transduction histidine kinase